MSRNEPEHQDVSEQEEHLPYNRKWEKKFKWLAPSSNGDGYFYCKICDKHKHGGLKQITLHCATRAHMSALLASTKEADLYFMDGRLTDSHKPSASPKKRRISESSAKAVNESEGTSKTASSAPKSKEFIHLQTLTSPVDGKKIVLNMERRLEPLVKPPKKKIVRQVAPYSRNSETQEAVETIEQQAEAGLLVEEEPEPPVVTPVQPVVTIKTEGTSRKVPVTNAPVNAPQRIVVEQRPEQDPFGVFGKHVANKLRSLTPEQNKFAQKLIMDVLFEGEMDSLDRNAKVVKCGMSCVCQH